MMLTNEIEHYICNSEIILKLDKPKKIIIWWVLLIVTDCHELLKIIQNSTKYNNV
jgi:hypothetical protein